MNINELYSRFEYARRNGSGFTARCPAHDDRVASLSVSEGKEGRILLFCHAGCGFENIIDAMGLTKEDVSPRLSGSETLLRTYDYVDQNNRLLFQACRYQRSDAEKTFKQRRPDGYGGWIWNLQDVELVLYRLYELCNSDADTAYVVEGEKDVDALCAMGLSATCNPMGSGKWRNEYSKWLAGKHVIILPDNDESGHRHAHAVETSVKKFCLSVKIVCLPGLGTKEDVSDWIARGGTKEKLERLVSESKGELEATEITLESAAYSYIDAISERGHDLLRLDIADLDYALGGGVMRGEFVIIGARPSHGKSAFGLMLMHNLTASGVPCAFVSEEMSALALGKRTVQFASSVPEEHWLTERRKIEDQLDHHFETTAPCFIVQSCRTVDNTMLALRKLREKHEVEAAVIDYVQLLSASGKDRYEQVTKTSASLRQFVNSTGMTLFVLAQLGRAIENRPRFIPKTVDFKESGQLEQDADVALALVWPYRLDSKRDPHVYQIYVLKNRNRPIHMTAFDCEFRPSRQKFSCVTPKQSVSWPDDDTTYQSSLDF